MADPVTLAAAAGGAAAAVGAVASLELAPPTKIGLVSSVLNSWSRSTEPKQQSYSQMEDSAGTAERHETMASIEESLTNVTTAHSNRQTENTTAWAETMLEAATTPNSIAPKISLEVSLEDGITASKSSNSASVSELSDDTPRRRRKNLVPIFFALAACIMVGAAIVAGLVFLKEDDVEESTTNTNIDVVPPTLNYGTTGSGKGNTSNGEEVGTMQVMTEAPTQALDLLLESLPPHTLKSLQDPTSPQFKAKEWLMEHPKLLEMSESRKLQLFVLATFYHSMEGPNWSYDKPKETWLNYSHHECAWHFEPVECFLRGHCHNVTQCNSNSEIVAISLQQLSLHQFGSNITLPPEIALLTSLNTLSLYYNSISAHLEDFLPTQFYGMSNLMELNLRTNQFEGTIPSLLGRMTNLNSLSLAGNRLTGTIPTQLGLMKGLTEAYLWRNQLNGRIPTHLGQLHANLEDLELFANTLTGQIPTQLALLTNIETLHLQQNALTGEIATEIGAMPKLRSLSLRQNKLTGTIPFQLASPATLEVLRLEDNSLEGSIPEQFANETSVDKLVRITLHSNDLNGTVPLHLCSLGAYDPFQKKGLSFDCRTGDPVHDAILDSDPEKGICGCDSWCPCWVIGSNNTGKPVGTVGDND